MKRKITMRTTAAGPDYVLAVDKSYDVNGDLAKQLVDGGYAAYANGQPAADKSAPAPPPPPADDTPPAKDDDAPPPPAKRTRNRFGGKKKK